MSRRFGSADVNITDWRLLIKVSLNSLCTHTISLADPLKSISGFDTEPLLEVTFNMSYWKVPELG